MKKSLLAQLCSEEPSSARKNNIPQSIPFGFHSVPRREHRGALCRWQRLTLTPTRTAAERRELFDWQETIQRFRKASVSPVLTPLTGSSTLFSFFPPALIVDSHELVGPFLWTRNKWAQNLARGLRCRLCTPMSDRYWGGNYDDPSPRDCRESPPAE